MITPKYFLAYSPKAGPRLRSFLFATAVFGVGLVMAFYLFPVPMLLDHWEWWETSRGDNPVGLVGYLYLAEDAWRWPITESYRLNPRDGINTFYSDLVPIGALLGKVWYQATGDLHLYFGHWILFSYGMQALIGWVIFRHLGLSRWLAFIGGILILLMPAFTFRVGHIGLIAHWVILLTILFYVRAVSVAGHRELYLGGVGVGSVLSINPYLLAMCGVIYFAGVAEAMRRKRIPLGKLITAILVMFVTSAAWALVLGIIGPGKHIPFDGGFGVYSMNLLSPVTPQRSSITGFSGVIDETGGQYEGFNYLGGGIILLGVMVLLCRRRLVFKGISSHPVLTAGLLGLILYAASDKVYLGHWYLGDLGYSNITGLHVLTSTLRSSGRLFWPVGYCTTIALVAVVARSTSLGVASAVLLGAVLVQWGDIQPLLAATKIEWQAKPELIDRVAFTKAAQRFTEFILYPHTACAPTSADRDVILQLQLIAARDNIPANAGFTNRDLPDCYELEKRFAANIGADSVSPNPLIVVARKNESSAAYLPYGWSPTLLFSQGTEGYSCREAGAVVVCGKSSYDLAGLGHEIEPTQLSIGERLSVAKEGAGVPFLGSGWSKGDERVRWANGSDTSLIGKLEHPICHTLTFSALVTPFSFGNYAVASTKITVNGNESGEIKLNGVGPQIVRHQVSLGDRCVETANVQLHFANLKSPRQVGMNPDIRKLSWLFEWFSVAEK